MNARTAQPVSRRDRPAKAPLSREAIVRAAVDLVHTEGLERLTMRRLAASLDTGAGSLYVYFRNVEHLYAALLDELLGEFDLSPGDRAEPWDDRVAGVLWSYAGVLFDNPSIARMSIFTRPNGPNYLRLIETLLALLDEGGVPTGAASWGIDLLLQYATASAAEHGTREQELDTVDADSDLARAIDQVTAEAYPTLYARREVIVAGEGAERFRWAVDVLLAGMRDAGNAAVPRAYEPKGPA
jgi:AcrR family transcriptional regulator